MPIGTCRPRDATSRSRAPMPGPSSGQEVCTHVPPRLRAGESGRRGTAHAVKRPSGNGHEHHPSRPREPRPRHPEPWQGHRAQWRPRQDMGNQVGGRFHHPARPARGTPPAPPATERVRCGKGALWRRGYQVHEVIPLHLDEELSRAFLRRDGAQGTRPVEADHRIRAWLCQGGRMHAGVHLRHGRRS